MSEYGKNTYPPIKQWHLKNIAREEIAEKSGYLFLVKSSIALIYELFSKYAHSFICFSPNFKFWRKGLIFGRVKSYLLISKKLWLDLHKRPFSGKISEWNKDLLKQSIQRDLNCNFHC